MQLARATAGTPDGLRPEQEPAALAAALQRALGGRRALVRQVAAAPAAPALREALRLSTAHIEALLGRLAALIPPERATNATRRAA